MRNKLTVATSALDARFALCGSFLPLALFLLAKLFRLVIPGGSASNVLFWSVLDFSFGGKCFV